MAKAQGGLANSSGNTLESTIVATLVSKGFIFAKYRDWVKNPSGFGKELLLKDAPYNSIYNHHAKTEFLLLSEKYQLQIRIECKWQQSAGSVDEKFPYLYLNCVETMPEKTIFLVVDGGGFKAGALEWLKRATKTLPYTDATDKEIKVLTLLEFLQWANHNLR